MLRPSSDLSVYLYADVVDMRKSIDGLSALIEQELELNSMSGTLFVPQGQASRFSATGRETK